MATVRRRIAAAGGDPGRIRVVAVTKGFGAAAARAALAAGLTDVGENYADELLAKAPALALPPGTPGPTWHFLGRVQRRKVARLAPVVAWWQGLARVVEAEAIARHRPGATVLVEVDVTAAPGRNGSRPAEVPALVDAARRCGLDVRGLMTVAPRLPDEARRAFALVRALADRLGLPECSMGMSDDYELAVGEGATMVRLGRVLFGPRPGGEPPGA